MAVTWPDGGRADGPPRSRLHFVRSFPESRFQPAAAPLWQFQTGLLPGSIGQKRLRRFTRFFRAFIAVFGFHTIPVYYHRGGRVSSGRRAFWGLCLGPEWAVCGTLYRAETKMLRFRPKSGILSQYIFVKIAELQKRHLRYHSGTAHLASVKGSRVKHEETV